jgi:hypothetical protein
MRKGVRVFTVGVLVALTTSIAGVGTALASDPSDGICEKSESGTMKIGSDNWLYECAPYNDAGKVGYYWQGY